MKFINLVKELVAPYNKALVPGFVAVCLFLLEFVGVLPEMTVEQALTIIGTIIFATIGVYTVPNKKQ